MGTPPPGRYLGADGEWHLTDQPPADGWWLAGDGQWYPPEPPQPAPVIPRAPAPPGRVKKWWRARSQPVQVALVLILVLAVVAGFALLAKAGAEQQECDEAQRAYDRYVEDHAGLEPVSTDPVWSDLRECARDGRLEPESLNDPDIWVPDG